MLNIPAIAAPYQLVGSSDAGDVEGLVVRPGRTPASWKSCTPYLRIPAATKTSSTPLTVKKRDRLTRIAPA